MGRLGTAFVLSGVDCGAWDTDTVVAFKSNGEISALVSCGGYTPNGLGFCDGQVECGKVSGVWTIQEH